MSSDDIAEETDPPTDVVRTALLKFVVSSLLALLCLVIGIVVISQRVAEARALEEAEERAERLAENLVRHVVDGNVRAREPRAVAELDALFRVRLADGSVTHMKVWDERGTVLWSDQKRLVGRRFELSPEVRGLFGTDSVVSEISSLEDPENVEERGEGPLVEVYAGARDADGFPLVFEGYFSTEPITAQQAAIVRSVLPVALGALLLLMAAVLPMALTLARRVQRSEAAHTRMTANALQASELERRRIAEELHDGVVQDLAGVCFTLAALERDLRKARPELLAALELASSVILRDLAALRSMMIEVHPPDLSGDGLRKAVADLVQRAHARGVHVEVSAPVDLCLSPPMARLVHRVVREALQNVTKHAGASEAEVSIDYSGGILEVTVQDNGSGFEPSAGSLEGHLGLQLLAEALQDTGGSVVLADRPGGGAVLVARLPFDNLATGPQGSPKSASPGLRSFRRSSGRGAFEVGAGRR